MLVSSFVQIQLIVLHCDELELIVLHCDELVVLFLQSLQSVLQECGSLLMGLFVSKGLLNLFMYVVTCDCVHCLQLVFKA